MGWISRSLGGLIGAALVVTGIMAGASGQDGGPRVNGVFGVDNRQFVVPSRMPWTAVGRIVFQQPGQCSGALVSPRVVLTAAHCVYGAGGHLDRPARFYAGYHKGTYAAVSRIASFWVPPRYDFLTQLDDPDVGGLDYGFLLLEDPIGLQTGWFETLRVTSEDFEAATARRWRPLSQGGYSADTSRQLSINVNCPVIAYARENTFSHLCDTMDGDSGSPLFVEKPGGGFQIVGVASTIVTGRNGHGVAVDSRAWADDLARYLDRYDPLHRYDRAITSGGDDR